MTDDESSPRATGADEPRVLEFSWDQIADILREHVERTGLVPQGTYRMGLQVTQSGFQLTCTPLPNVHILPTRKKP